MSMVASYYRFDSEVYFEFLSKVAISTCEIVGDVFRAKLQKKFFLACLLVIRKNLCLQNFHTIWYIF